ncbi:hypothetical protein EAI_05738 [Harpegnathos saltator]|uniref:Uncharacterized protein n=1 Tax=Harpegnathos saltator TaxID=610380 RepID=E2C060_HARSA|nr:hypothetical protein EAI_05738 [Harpegnathos saltator]
MRWHSGRTTMQQRVKHYVLMHLFCYTRSPHNGSVQFPVRFVLAEKCVNAVAESESPRFFANSHDPVSPSDDLADNALVRHFCSLDIVQGGQKFLGKLK